MVEELSDVNLMIGSNIIAVHQIILAAHSTLLAGETDSEPGLWSSNLGIQSCCDKSEGHCGTVSRKALESTVKSRFIKNIFATIFKQ